MHEIGIINQWDCHDDMNNYNCETYTGVVAYEISEDADFLV